MHDGNILAGVAGGVAAIGVTILIFRIQRELRMHEKGEITWVAFCDWLVIVATIVSLLFVILPVVVGDPATQGPLPAAAAALGVILMIGWIPSVLAHYRLILGKNRTGPRTNPEPAEGLLVILFGVLGLVIFGLVFFS